MLRRATHPPSFVGARMQHTAEALIRHLGLQPLPHEGGYYSETHRSLETIAQTSLPARYKGSRSCSTAIYYLLTANCCSKFHRLPSDEIWHFYLGDPVEMVQLFPDSSGKIILMGSEVLADQHCQVIVPHGTWQGAKLSPGGHFALMGCTVAPGFDFADFELGSKDLLVSRYPGFASWIEALT